MESSTPAAQQDLDLEKHTQEQILSVYTRPYITDHGVALVSARGWTLALMFQHTSLLCPSCRTSGGRIGPR